MSPPAGTPIAIVGAFVIGITSSIVSTPVLAKSNSACATQWGGGTGATADVAKFQVYESMLQAADLALWASWMANGTTPGYKVGVVKYRCTKGAGLGYACRGQATVCKL